MSIFLSKKMCYFMVIMKNKNFGKAAEELCITRSPLSKVVTELEQLLGGRLFERKHNKLEPTPLAWECYKKFINFYHDILELEEKLIPSRKSKNITVFFDITFPELLIKQILMVLHYNNIKINFQRISVSIEDICNMERNKNIVIVSLRKLDVQNTEFHHSWEGGTPIIIGKQNNNLATQKCHFFIWKDQYSFYIQDRYKYILSGIGCTPEFIEHNYDLSTLLYLVHYGKGLIMATSKIARIYQIDKNEITKVNDTIIKCYFYFSQDMKNTMVIEKLKQTLQNFI